MEILIQHDVYIWAYYSVSSYLNFIPICWNVSIWLKYETGGLVSSQWKKYIKYSVYHVTELANEIVWKPHHM
jgi:hypothetical protein